MTWRAGAVIGGVTAAVVAGAVVVAVSGGGGGDDDVAATVGSKRGTSSSTATTVPEPDRLCVAHQTLEDAISALGTVDSPADREAFVRAELAFYSDAAGREPEPDATAFRMFAQYFDALRVFFETRGWQNATLNDLAEMPRPPTGDSGPRTNQILADRCGVSAPTDTPVGATP